MSENRKFKGVWIPAELWETEELSITEKCLLVEIDSLDNDPDRGCFASNEYLGKFLRLSSGRTANMISDLRKRGFIAQVFFDGRNRGLRVPMLHENVLNLHENVKPAFTKTLKQASRKREHSNTGSKNSIESANAPAPAEIVSRNSSETASDPLAYKKAISIFSAEAAARGITYPSQFEEAYFLHQQAAGRYYDITPPLPGNDTHRWFSKHYAGLQSWAKRQPQFDRPGPQGAQEKPASLSFSIGKK